jgi:hypothetical protein
MKASDFPLFSRPQNMMDQVLRHEEFFMRWWVHCIRRSGGGLTPKVTDIIKYPNDLLPTISKVTEDDGPSFKRTGIFCEVVDLMYLEVWSGWTPEVRHIRNHSNKFVPTFLDVTEDDRPSVETPGIFYEVVDLVYLVVRDG